MTGAPLSVLVLGAGYGLLAATRFAQAGHAVTAVARPAEAAAIRAAGVALTLPARGTGRALDIRMEARAEPAPGALAVTGPEGAEGRHDLAVLAMQEPQYAAPEIAALLRRLAGARVPCLSLMNVPPPPFLARLGPRPPGVEACYASRDAWDGFDPALVTMASADAQALGTGRPGALRVTLPTNFKIAPFADAGAQAVLARLAASAGAVRIATPEGPAEPRIRFVAHPAARIPLAKWPMLIAGNCRCVTDGAPVPISDAVGADPAGSRAVYDAVLRLTRGLGLAPGDAVPFERYAAAARGLTAPSSLARGLAAGAAAVERIDRVVAAYAALHGVAVPGLAETAARIDRKLAENAAPASRAAG